MVGNCSSPQSKDGSAMSSNDSLSNKTNVNSSSDSDNESGSSVPHIVISGEPHSDHEDSSFGPINLEKISAAENNNGSVFPVKTRSNSDPIALGIDDIDAIVQGQPAPCSGECSGEVLATKSPSSFPELFDIFNEGLKSDNEVESMNNSQEGIIIPENDCKKQINVEESEEKSSEGEDNGYAAVRFLKQRTLDEPLNVVNMERNEQKRTYRTDTEFRRP
eukprot:UN32454